MSIGSGIAIAGIWIGVAGMAWADFVVGFLGLPCALMGTVAIAYSNTEREPQPNGATNITENITDLIEDRS